jgi:hypothetical protein
MERLEKLKVKQSSFVGTGTQKSCEINVCEEDKSKNTIVCPKLHREKSKIMSHIEHEKNQFFLLYEKEQIKKLKKVY